jgi:hypothetical protein
VALQKAPALASRDVVLYWHEDRPRMSITVRCGGGGARRGAAVGR